MEKIKLNKSSSNNFLQEIASSPLLKEYNVTINNCNMFNQYLKIVGNCKNCKDISECKNEPVGMSALIVTNPNSYQLKRQYCQYMQEEKRKEEVAKRFQTLFMPKAIKDASFDNFNVNNLTRQKIYKFANDFANNYQKNTSTKGLYIAGNFQIGKTYALASTANLLAQKGIDSLLIYLPDMIRELKSLLNSGEFEDKINMLKSVDVLMLDDIGAEMPSAWVRDEILCPILNYRLQEGLPVFFSSNYTINGLRDFYTRIDNSANNADRLIARIKNIAAFIEME